MQAFDDLVFELWDHCILEVEVRILARQCEKVGLIHGLDDGFETVPCELCRDILPEILVFPLCDLDENLLLRSDKAASQ